MARNTSQLAAFKKVYIQPCFHQNLFYFSTHYFKRETLVRETQEQKTATWWLLDDIRKMSYGHYKFFHYSSIQNFTLSTI